jgi:D-tagatose-1,6-bisphosphate aldolase subunit GatZ/KbaZ
MSESGPRRLGPLAEILSSHKSGVPVGMYSLCSAHPAVLEACMHQGGGTLHPLLVEATSNQVNQFGGYTGMDPAAFVAFVREIADRAGFPIEQIILGGDHLGPNAWQHEDAATAMDKARHMVRDYVLAGFEKIHLDASMRCADDPADPLPETLVADRAADLCYVAEEAYRERGDGARAPLYVVGTEVPVPGGARDTGETLTVTTPEAARRTIEVTRAAFHRRGLHAAWERVIATVVQPGVEFGDEVVMEYQPARAAGLSHVIDDYEGLVFEAHSTDYQRESALQELVRDHFAILKVGPALTFAFREAVFALENVETEYLAGRPGIALSGLGRTMEDVMLRSPGYWRRYYHGDESDLLSARRYSYSDRIRYYWTDPEAQRALRLLIENLAEHPAPLTLISQFLPREYEAVRNGEIANHPMALIHHRIRDVQSTYARACGLLQE